MIFCLTYRWRTSNGWNLILSHVLYKEWVHYILMCFMRNYSLSHGLTFHFPSVKQQCFTVAPALEDGQEEPGANAPIWGFCLQPCLLWGGRWITLLMFLLLCIILITLFLAILGYDRYVLYLDYVVIELWLVDYDVRFVLMIILL